MAKKKSIAVPSQTSSEEKSGGEANKDSKTALTFFAPLVGGALGALLVSLPVEIFKGNEYRRNDALVNHFNPAQAEFSLCYDKRNIAKWSYLRSTMEYSSISYLPLDARTL
jgi:hypothetical protein